MQRTISAMVGKGSVNHNSRKFRAENVDGTRTHLNIDYCNENIKTVYHELFDEAVERYNAKQKTYRYVINNSKQGTAIYRDLECHIPMELDIEEMKKAAKHFEGEHDFKAFKASGTSSKSSVRTIYKAEVIEEGNRIKIELTGNGFLYNMVRIISGTLVDVGLGKIKTEDIPNIIESEDRAKAGKTLPAHGLYLVEVKYN